MADIFNIDFPEEVAKELDRRTKHPQDWMYRKYATISVRTTGVSSTIICSEPSAIIGDAVQSESHLALYNTEGNIRKFKPTLESVTITNNGGQDYTDSYLYEIDINFKVFSLEDMNSIEKSFFRVGAEIEILFGWKGYSNAENNGKILAAIYNFGFQMESDGAFSCNVKAMSAAGIFGSDRLGGDKRTEDLGLSEETTGTDKKITNFAEAFYLKARETFGIEADDEEPSISGLPGNTMIVRRFPTNTKYKFAALELEKPAGFFDTVFTGGDDTTVLYTTLQNLILYINESNDESFGGFEIILQNGEGSEYKLSPEQWKEFGSANPFKVLIPNAADYGDLKLTSKIEEIGNDTTDFGKILINISEIVSIYNNLYENQSTAKTAKTAPKVKEFLEEIFKIISDSTGGVTRLQLRPIDINMDSSNNGSATKNNRQKLEIINRGMIPGTGIAKKVYEFKVLEQSSIIRGVSLQSNFDTDFLIAATPKAIRDGNSPNRRAILSLYDNCPNVGLLPFDSDNLVKKEDILNAKINIGNDGWTESKSSALITQIRKYITQDTVNITEGSYSEIPFLLDLSVTIDGIHGIEYMAPIIIDRIPARFKSRGSALIEFAITSIEHKFDGQGDWETTLGTVMRIK